MTEIICTRPECQTTAGCQCNRPSHTFNLRRGLENVARSLASRPVELRGPFESSATKRGDGK